MQSICIGHSGEKELRPAVADVGAAGQTLCVPPTGLDYLAQGLRDAGQVVIEMPLDANYRFAGAFRCWNHPLARASWIEWMERGAPGAVNAH